MMRKLATDHAGLEILHLGDCFLLLKSVPVGRVGFVAGGEVAVMPVNFGVDGQDVVFRTGNGSKLASVPVGQYVTFEADAYDTATQAGWSVMISGLAEVVAADPDCARLDGLGLRPWGGPAADQAWIRIRPVTITGRRIAEADAES
jgi:hypothetical protein